MRRPRLLLVTAGAVLALPVWLIGSSPSAGQGASSAEKARIVSQLAGSWQLVSFAVRSADGALSYPFGKDALGKLTYTRGGTQWATIGRRGASKNLPDAFWYTGTFDVNLKQRTVIHHVQYSSISAWEGTDLVRSFKLRRDRRLTLTIAPSAPGGQSGIARWKKLRVHALDADGMSE
jgi:Lipocalin-like domain